MKTTRATVDAFCQANYLTVAQFYGRDKWNGDMTLDSLTSIPDGFKPTVEGGDLCLNNLESIPEGFNPTVGGDLYLNNLTSIPEGFNPTVGGHLDLNNLESIPEGFNPTVGGDLYLNNLTSIPEGFNPTVGGNLNLNSLESIPEGFNPTVGGGLYLNSLKSIPEGFNPTVGGDLYLHSRVAPTKSVLPVPLSWDSGKYILADGLLSEVIQHRGRVYRVKIVGKSKASYLVTNGKEWSHGETLAEARADLLYKVSDRNPDQFKDLTPKSKLSFAEAVACYRTITGACAAGVKGFVEQNDLRNVKSISVENIIKKTVGQYGGSKFAAFFTKK